MREQRIISLDLMRCFSFGLIIAYHFMIGLEMLGAYHYAESRFYYTNANMHIADLGVGLFFMLSGFGLMLSGQNGFRLRDYYKKRFFKILVPFYITYLMTLVYQLIDSGQTPFGQDIPKWRILFTLFGADEYVAAMGLKTFSLGIGEWFLGCLIGMYILFPALRALMRKAPLLTVVLTGLIYVYIVFDYHYVIFVQMNFFVKLFEFVLGMYLATVYQKIPRQILIPATFIVSVFLFYKEKINLQDGLKITLLVLCVFIIFLLLDEPCSRLKRIWKPVMLLSGCSYELFLVHHRVIYEIGDHFVAGRLLSTKRMLALAVIEFAVMVVLGAVVHLLQKSIQSRCCRSSGRC